VSAPLASVPAGTLTLVSPFAKVDCALYDPLAMVTDPVGGSWPLVPAVTFTVNGCWSVIAVAEAFRVRAGVTLLTVTAADAAVAVLKTGALAASGA
jgi:hypothetical protein